MFEIRYICLDCGYNWDVKVRTVLGYRQCPNAECRSYDVAPATFWKMVETGRKLGIDHNTPIQDIFDAFQAVFQEEGLLLLGFIEFWRVMRRVIREIENPKYKTGSISIEME